LPAAKKSTATVSERQEEPISVAEDEQEESFPELTSPQPENPQPRGG